MSRRRPEGQDSTAYSGDVESYIIKRDDDPDAQAFRELVMKDETAYKDDQILYVYFCANKDTGLIRLFSGEVYIYDSKTAKLLKTIYTVEGGINSFYFDDKNSYYYISSNNLEILDKDLKNICSIKGCWHVGMIPGTADSMLRETDPSAANEYVKNYRFHPLSFNEVISIAKDYLGDYEPDERVKTKYGLE